jgi:hypothetical protein
VAYEIHRLWDIFSPEALKLTLSGKSSTGTGMTHSNRHRSGSNVSTNTVLSVAGTPGTLAVDEWESTFTASFLFHVAPAYHEALTSLKKLETSSALKVEEIKSFLAADHSFHHPVNGAARSASGDECGIVDTSKGFKSPTRSTSVASTVDPQPDAVTPRKWPSAVATFASSIKRSNSVSSSAAGRRLASPSPIFSPVQQLQKIVPGLYFPMVRSSLSSAADATTIDNLGASLLSTVSSDEVEGSPSFKYVFPI